MHILEICAPSFASAIAAQSGGADRIELCSDLKIGGVTPSADIISSVRRQLTIPINVLLRPRGGDFVYSDTENEEVIRGIELCAGLGVAGVVVGALTPSGQVDMYMCREWVRYAHSKGLTVTFHRAVDETSDIFEALARVIELGCEIVLTSGGFPTAIEGREIIKQMCQKAGDRIVIMPGSGINDSNIASLAEYTGARQLHFSATKDSAGHTYPDSQSTLIAAAAASLRG